jgi:hypothetical protein
MSVLFNYDGLRKNLSKISKSLKQVNGNQYNCKFSFNIGSGIVAINPDTGNYDLETTSTVVIKAQLRVLKEETDNINIGTPFTRIRLQGHLSEPLNYAGEFTQYIDCELLNDGIWLTGKFYPELKVSSALVETFSLSSALGTAITGYFETNGNLAG